MVVAMLFDEQDELIAAAPGCDQQPLGDRYWRQFYPQPLPARLGETALLDIQDIELARLLLRLADHPDALEQCRASFRAFERRHSELTGHGVRAA